jgi:hypothetical protein
VGRREGDAINLHIDSSLFALAASDGDMRIGISKLLIAEVFICS